MIIIITIIAIILNIAGIIIWYHDPYDPLKEFLRNLENQNK